MLRLEKVFQNDDKFFIYFQFVFKSLIIFIFIYLFSILEKNTIYDIKNFKIYLNSNYYFFSIFLPIFFFFSNFISLKKKKFFYQTYKRNFSEIKILLIDIIIIIFILNIEKNILKINKEFIFLIFLIIFIIFFLNKIIFQFYIYLIKSNIIQRNILLVGKYKDVLKIFYEKKNLINVYKCCIITDIDKRVSKTLRNEIKIPIFDINEDVRSILEYHHLGQVWILDNSYEQKVIEEMISYIIKYSVDILVVKIDKISNKKNSELINNKYEYIEYEVSRFYGINFLLKIIIDKILSLLFLVILSPLLFISSLLIYLEDGFPIFFFQDRTGWDGRRFRIYKLRTLKNVKFDKTKQVLKNDERKMKIGKFLRTYSIDEVPQFINVLIGDMSIVGPRPHMVEHDIYYSKIFKEFLKRNKTAPGLTGLAQINGLRGPTPDHLSMQKRMEYDLWYLNNWTPTLDIIIIIKTFYALLRYKGD